MQRILLSRAWRYEPKDLGRATLTVEVEGVAIALELFHADGHQRGVAVWRVGRRVLAIVDSVEV